MAKLDLRGRNDDFPSVKRIDRPWGYYKLFAENIPCTAKVLHIRKNEMLSLQYHRLRDQVYYCMDDFTIWLSDISVPIEIDNNLNELVLFIADHLKKRICKKGDIIYIPKFFIHRPIYQGLYEYGCIVDMAFGHNDENDIVRINDKYGRENKT